jgi:insecticidal toxin complex protein TccC
MGNVWIHHATPTLTVIDPRGLSVRDVAYWRSTAGQTPQARVTRQVFDAAGRGIEQWDSRLSVPALKHGFSLTGQVLATDSVDAGWRVSMLGRAGENLSRWDSRGAWQGFEYDRLLRPMAVMEQARGGAGHVVERFEYGDAGFESGNQCGRLIRHDDPAGTRHMPEYDVLGMAQREVSHFLAVLGAPDWPQDPGQRDQLLESVPGLESRRVYGPAGSLLSLTDAKSHRRHFTYTVAGQLQGGWLQSANTPSPGQCLVRDIHYNPAGQVAQETAGNGVVTEADYAPDDGRLLRLCAGLPNAPPLQDLRYAYDPVGNILQHDDHALPIRYFNNQRIDGVRVYGYDSLGQLISATGWEADMPPVYPVAGYRAANDPAAVANYREEYDYDAAGNMTELRHLGAHPFTRRWAIAANSNRSLLEDDQPPDFATGFDGNGNLRFLRRGQALSWDVRNQLSSVSPVVRDGEEDDEERYIYGGGGKRLRKVRMSRVSARTVIVEVRYLPGLEIHQRHNSEEHQVLDLDAGRNRVQWLHGPNVPAFQLRYQLTDHQGSATLELDERARVQSREVYYPFGGTAWEDHSDQSGAYKTVRYSGKERDATGLYYYGYRYLATWLCRWINPDPAGAVDGLNLYGFVGNSPVGRVDADGRMWSGADSLFGDDSQESVPDDVFHTFVTPGTNSVPPIVIDQYDLSSQNSAWSMSGLFEAPATLTELSFGNALASSMPAVPASYSINVTLPTTSPVLTRQYPCDTCGKVFSQPSNRSKHMRSHTGEKSFMCDRSDCSRTFSQRKDLDNHVRSHTSEKPYRCVEADCNAAFSTSTHLSRHKRTVHATTAVKSIHINATVKKFSCPILDCDRIHGSKSELDRHVETHSKIKGSCPYPGCFSRATTKKSFNEHIRLKHGGKLPAR